MENIDSGWQRKEWECVDNWRGKGCGWKGFGSECQTVDWFECLMEKGCPLCGNQIFNVEFPLVGVSAGTSTH